MVGSPAQGHSHMVIYCLLRHEDLITEFWPFSTEIIKRAWGLFIKFHWFVTGDIQLQLGEVLSSGGYLY